MISLTASFSEIFQPQSMHPQSGESQAGAAFQVAAMKQQATILKETATASLISEVVRTLVQDGNPIALINRMRGGASVSSCFGKPEFYDARPYAVALNASYPDFAKDASKLLNDGLSRQSIPMVLSALLVNRDRLPVLLAPLSGDQLAMLLRLLWLAQSDRELRYLFQSNQP